MRYRWIVQCFALLMTVQAHAETDRDDIQQILNAMKLGWEQADGAPFREHFLDYEGARYVESGGQNVGLTDLIEHHVEPEGKALKLELDFTEADINIEGDFAWVVFNTEVRATVFATNREIHNKGFETVILRKIEGKWKVLHTHSSSRPVKKD